MASGIARIPVPMFPFNMWIIVSQFLNNKYPFSFTVRIIVSQFLNNKYPVINNMWIIVSQFLNTNIQSAS